MKKNIYFVICLVMLIGLIAEAGCVNTSSQNELSVAVRGNGETHQVSENIWWVKCDEWKTCDPALSNLSQNHKILSFAPLTNGAYGATTGYYVIVDQSEGISK